MSINRIIGSSPILTAQAPSNIALVKYMGKEDSVENLPANGSLSLTLDALCSIAEVTQRRVVPGTPRPAVWRPELPRLAPRDAEVPALSESGIARILRHIERVQSRAPAVLREYGLELGPVGELELRTANTFPMAAGIASSASSFAAVTLAVAQSLARDPEQFERAYADQRELRRALARISRAGSGSSCRSFEGPWVIWEGAEVGGLELGASTTHPEAASPIAALTDLILIAGQGGRRVKSVSSSDAHHLVMTSPLWDGRTSRAQQRLRMIEAAIAEGDLATISRASWSEAWEMHSLFHTCAHPFTYWEPETIRVLRYLGHYIGDVEWPLIATLDAGPNVHVLVPTEHAEIWRERFAVELPDCAVLEDRQGRGARVLEVGEKGGRA